MTAASVEGLFAEQSDHMAKGITRKKGKEREGKRGPILPVCGGISPTLRAESSQSNYLLEVPRVNTFTMAIMFQHEGTDPQSIANVNTIKPLKVMPCGF